MKNILKPNRVWINLSILFAFITSVFFLLEIYTTKYIISIADKEQTLNITVATIILMIYILSYLTYYTKLRIFSKTAYLNKKLLNGLYFNSILSNTVETFRDKEINKNASVNFNTKFNLINNNYYEEIYDSVFEFTFLVLGTIYLAINDWRIALISIVFYLLSIKVTQIFAMKSSNLVDKYTKHLSEFVTRSKDLINSALQIVVYDRIKFTNTHFSDSLNSYIVSLKKSNVNKQIFTYTNDLISMIREIAILTFIAFFIKDINVSYIFIIVYLSTMLSEPFKRANNHIHSIKSTGALREDVQRAVSNVKNQGVVNHGQLVRVEEIVLENIEKQYGNKRIINNLNLFLKSKNKYLIIGESGSGKSTLLNIITGVTKPDKGKVYINGKNLLSEEELYGSYSLISQNDTVFNSTLKNNIIMFNKDFDAEKYEKIKKLVKLNMDDSLILDGDNLNISGGELQKILLARVLYHNVNCIFLDEAYSALDASTAKDMEELILSLKDCMIINISHHVVKENMNLYDMVLNYDIL